MECPVTKQPMIVLELQEIEIDYSPSCGGIWLDSGELELLLETTEERTRLMNTFRREPNPKEALLKCPICGTKMDKLWVGDTKQVLIDACKNNHGLWFDKGELQEVVALGSGEKENKVVQLLNDMFAFTLKHK